MKRLMSSLHVTRWVRVIAIAGVVVAYGATADKDMSKDGGSASYSAARSSNGWCPRC